MGLPSRRLTRTRTQLDTTTGYNGTHTIGGISVDDQNLTRWYATGDANRTNVLILNYVYALPFFRNSSSGFPAEWVGRMEVQRHFQLLHWSATD